MFSDPYISDKWQQRLGNAGLSDFASWWQFPGEWVEEPNQRRGGWSGVVYSEITDADGTNIGLYIKRQSNHNARNWRHPFKGEPTLVREFRNIMYCRANGIATLEPVYFATHSESAEQRAQMVTLALSNLKPLDESPYFNEPELIPVIADTLRKLHAARLQHSSLYPKHLFVGRENGLLVARLIDMEKSRKRLSSYRACVHDLDTLNRHMPDVSLRRKLRFLLEYLQEDRVTGQVRDLWKKLSQRAATKKRTR